MAENLFELVFVRPGKLLISLATKFFGENHADTPRTIIGKDYIWDSHHQMSTTGQFAQTGNNLHSIKIRKGRTVGSPVIVPYRPLYRDIEDAVQGETKQMAWMHVLRNSNDEGGESETTRRYLEAMEGVEGECRALYGGGTVEDRGGTVEDQLIASLSSEQFIWMLILDGCYLLQIALYVLGGSEQLAYLTDDPLYVQFRRQDFIRDAVSSMFVGGNQIPILVLNELMKQSFFTKVFNQGLWNQPRDLERWALFELLLVPMLLDKSSGGGPTMIPTTRMCTNKRRSRRWILAFRSGISLIVNQIAFGGFWFKRKAPTQKPRDLLHGLWLLMTGLANSNETYETFAESSCYYPDFVVLPMVPTAIDLKEAGIVIKCCKSPMFSAVRFEKTMFNPVLWLPQILINSGTTDLLANLLLYEEEHGIRGSSSKIHACLQLMSELIRTIDDAKVLVNSGVFLMDADQRTHPKLIIMSLLQKLESVRVEVLVRQSFRGSRGGISVKTDKSSLSWVRDELINYTPPSLFRSVSDILGLVILLTVVQTIYAILSFHLRK